MKKVFGLVLLVFVILIGVFFAGCTQPNKPDSDSQQPKTEEPKAQEPKKQEPPRQKLSPGDFFPVSVGSTWNYEGKGNEFASFTRKVLFASGDRAQIREDNGGTVSAAVFRISPDSVSRIYFMGEAYNQENYLNNDPKEDIIILKAPLEAGSKWEEPNGTREIVDINAKVDTPAGIFDECIKVKISSKDSTLYEFYKKGIGLVKREFHSGDTVVTSTLRDYSIK